MKYTYNDILTYLPDLKKYVKSKVKTDWWKDVVQEVLLYLYIKFKSIIITDLKGLIINTAKMFINKHISTNTRLVFVNELTTDNSMVQNHSFILSGYNVDIIDDNLFKNIQNVSKLIFAPFKMQLDDMRIKEIAQELNINENTVKTRIMRCKTYLKQGL
jgi:DNA-directed RNA polymerase specialized sigma24 family protein